MSVDEKRLRWFALAGAGFLATILVPTLLMPDAWQVRYPDAPDDPVWGILMGVTCYALINAVVLRTQRDKSDGATRMPRIGVFAALTPVLGGVAVLMLAGQTGMIPGWPAVLQFNTAQIATMLVLALIAPTEAQGLLMPLGDERFRTNQHRAQSLALRIAFVACLSLGALASYGLVSVPLPVILSALATLIASAYLAALWWLERRDGA